jgi:predicted N-acetyltransferase YhbS
MDSRHFWPGVPTDFPALNNFLTIEGFDLSGEYFDIERDISNYQPPRPMPTENVEFRVLTPDDKRSLEKFFDREFPGRWRYDILWKIEREDGYGGLVGLFHKDAVWRNDLGESWGALGPIGVSQQVRGEGWGGALLSAGLLELKARGTKQCIIDWTTLGEFYGKHGFEKSRIYRSAKLEL